MKIFVYDWTDEIYLLHAQVDLSGAIEGSVRLTRFFTGDSEKIENKKLLEQSHRFIISRTHPNEAKIQIEYGNTDKLTIYEIDDRAYYPTTTFFEG